MAFTDGTSVGAVLDRNGLRPARYYVTLDDTVILASEVGVLDIPADRIIRKERLQPGRMLLIDTKEGRIIDDEEIKEKAAAEHPYRVWLDEHMIRLEDLPPPPVSPSPTTRPCSGWKRPSATPTRTRGSSSSPWSRRRRSHRLDGQRYSLGRALGQASAPVQLLQAAFRQVTNPP